MHIKQLKDSSLNTSVNESFKSFKFGDIIFKKYWQIKKSQGAVHTNYQWLNDVFPPHDGIELGQRASYVQRLGVGG